MISSFELFHMIFTISVYIILLFTINLFKLYPFMIFSPPLKYASVCVFSL